MESFELNRKISFGPSEDFLNELIYEDLENLYVHLNEPRRLREDECEGDIGDDFSLSSHISTATFYKIEEEEENEDGDFYPIKEKIGFIKFYRTQEFINIGTFDFFDAHSGDSLDAFQNLNEDLEPYDTYIETLFIENEERQRGYGKKLLQWIESYAGEKIYFNVPNGETDFSGKKWETVPDFYEKSFSKIKFQRRVEKTFVFEK